MASGIVFYRECKKIIKESFNDCCLLLYSSLLFVFVCLFVFCLFGLFWGFLCLFVLCFFVVVVVVCFVFVLCLFCVCFFVVVCFFYVYCFFCRLIHYIDSKSENPRFFKKCNLRFSSRWPNARQ
jgi:hypothetical protein